MHTTIRYNGAKPIDSVLSTIVNFVETHHFEEGIHLVKRRATTSKAAEHYGFAVVGPSVRYFSSFFVGPIVIHKTNLGVNPDLFEPNVWEKVETLNGNILDAVMRANLSYQDTYDLLFDNCEHFARFVVTGRKESTQVRNFAIVGLAALGIWALWKTNN